MKYYFVQEKFLSLGNSNWHFSCLDVFAQSSQMEDEMSSELSITELLIARFQPFTTHL